MQTTQESLALDDFTQGYIDAALWLLDENPGPGEWTQHDAYVKENIEPAALMLIASECERFQRENEADLAAGGRRTPGYTAGECAGHDFYLTRNHHGAGFWDGDWPEEAGERLTAAAHRFGESQLYFGDDGLIYVE